MLAETTLTGYELVVGLATVLGVAHVGGWQRPVIERPRFLLATGGGLVLFLVGGPVATLLVPDVVHWVHGAAALLVVAGTADPVARELDRGEWIDLLVADPGRLRPAAEWMLPVDDAVLDVLYESDLVLTPAVVAYNVDYRRETVNRRLRELEARGFVTRVERGKYRIGTLGVQYVEGAASTGLVRSLRQLWRAARDR